ncbi:hypothetical protein ACFPM0_19645 [Pseudonocardia sulfidoxydans]|uniref:hypothetical protein n=1 Tax=Pseudonocardia sulfidoxydans TaxID=54011 RepID=UPI0036131B4C
MTPPGGGPAVPTPSLTAGTGESARPARPRRARPRGGAAPVVGGKERVSPRRSRCRDR